MLIGCPASTTTTVRLFQPTSLNVSVTFSNNNTRFRLNVSGGTLTASNATYTWSGPASFTSSSKQTGYITAVGSHYGVYTITVITANGCRLESAIRVSAPVFKTSSESEENLESNIQGLEIYPNPVKQLMTIKSEKTISHILIQNMLGEVVMKEMEAKETIDLSHLPIGMYLVVVRFDDQTQAIKKFVKE